MLSAADRRKLETLIAGDPFAALLVPSLVDAVRTDDLVATLFLHRQEERNGMNGCACGALRAGDIHTLHLADMVRRCLADGSS